MSGSRDTTLRVWDIETGRCLHVLLGHDAAVRCVQYDGKLVVSGAYDNLVRVWDPETEACLHILKGHDLRVYSLQVSRVNYYLSTYYFITYVEITERNRVESVRSEDKIDSSLVVIR